MKYLGHIYMKDIFSLFELATSTGILFFLGFHRSPRCSGLHWLLPGTTEPLLVSSCSVLFQISKCSSGRCVFCLCFCWLLVFVVDITSSPILFPLSSSPSSSLFIFPPLPPLFLSISGVVFWIWNASYRFIFWMPSSQLWWWLPGLSGAGPKQVSRKRLWRPRRPPALTSSLCFLPAVMWRSSPTTPLTGAEPPWGTEKSLWSHESKVHPHTLQLFCPIVWYSSWKNNPVSDAVTENKTKNQKTST